MDEKKSRGYDYSMFLSTTNENEKMEFCVGIAVGEGRPKNGKVFFFSFFERKKWHCKRTSRRAATYGEGWRRKKGVEELRQENVQIWLGGG